MRLLPAPAAALLLAASAPALAQDEGAASGPVDVGVIRDSDKRVVQKLLYSKEGRLEYGLAAGWMPFDSYTTTPLLAINAGYHFSEGLGAELVIDGGYSLKNFTYKQLESDAYGIQPDAYRHMLGVMADVMWSPVYAKMSWRGKKVLHHDLYGLLGAGGSLEQAMMPDGSTTFSPGVGLGVGMRIFAGQSGLIRLQLRDDILVQKRVKTADTQGTFVKQNVSLTVGYSRLGKAK